MRRWSMDRSEAATLLFAWQLEGDGDLVRAAGRGSDSLRATVEALASLRPHRPPNPPAPSEPYLRLDEERAVAALRQRLYRLAPVLAPEEWEAMRTRLEPPLLPRARIAAIRAELDRFGPRLERRVLQREFEAQIAPAQPALRALLLFARDGRLLAGDGDVRIAGLPTLSSLVEGAEPGCSWTLHQRAGVLVGHRSHRAAFVAAFASRPNGKAASTLRIALEALERQERLLNAPDHASNHAALLAFVRAIRERLDPL